MPDLVNLTGDGGKWMLCYTRRKRSRDATPLAGAEKKQQPEPCSLDALPDECLYEILRRLAGNRERSSAACISKRWLMLLSGVRPSEPSLEEEETPKSTPGIEDEIKNTGCLTRRLEGRVTDVTVAAIAVGTAGRGGLGDLAIHGSHETPGITDLGLSAVARCCPSLKVLSVGRVSSITDAGLAELARGCPMMVSLDLCGCRYVSDAGLKSFVKFAHALEILHVEECDRITFGGVLAPLVNRNTKIETLGFVGCLGINEVGSCPDGLPVCESLRTLTIHGCPGFTSANLAVVRKICPRLIDLDLEGLVGVTDVVIGSDAASLDYVTLQGCANIVDSAICALVEQHGECLHFLNLGGCTKLTDRALLAITEHCKVLEVLDMSGSDITDYGVALLASARHLNVHYLSFGGCDKLTPRSFPLFVNMGQTLDSMNIRWCNLISDLDISSLGEKMWWCFME